MFKEKSSKKRIHIIDSAKETSTLDARHNQMINTLQINQSNISILETKLKNINNEICKIENSIKEHKLNNNIDNDEYNNIWNKYLLIK